MPAVALLEKPETFHIYNLFNGLQAIVLCQLDLPTQKWSGSNWHDIKAKLTIISSKGSDKLYVDRHAIYQQDVTIYFVYK